MKIDITSMFFNSRIEGQTATPAWGTSIGQNKSRACRIDDFKPEVVDMVIGMTYKSVADIDKLDVSKGSGNRDIITCSVFEDVYINNKKIDDTQYVLLLVREHSKSHDGRLLISYAPYIKYNGIENQSCIELMQQLLGCSAEGCWFVYDISIKNQSELYFSAVVVNPSSPMVYSNSIKSKNRSEEWKALIPSEGETEPGIKNSISDTLQQIFYGAPGTGKSNTIKCEVNQNDFPRVRTTFHPDSDYSTFVGAYKPTSVEVPMMTMIGTKAVPAENPDGTPRKEKKIIYEFVPQAFLKAYTGAWKNQDEPFFLIIEEINRGNCAQIFGDLFQLLDRNDETGLSDYPISPDEDIQKFLLTDKKYGFAALTDEQKASIPAEVQSGELMILPKNLHIWATMNTSDQSLFPIDSAFKRRWDWQYMPISDAQKGWQIEANGKRYDWWQFLQKMNDKIGSTTNSEDKKLGYFFCKAKNGIIDSETFVGKVVFYIWNDVFKDFAEEAGDLFKDSSDPQNPLLSFNKFYTIGMDGKAKVVDEKVEQLFQNLGVNPLAESEIDEEDEEESETTEGKDYTRYTINGEGSIPKRQLSTQAVRKYIELNPELTPEQVVANWMSLGNIVSHFVETKEQFDSRTDNSKRSLEVPCGDTIIYVAWNGWGIGNKMQTLIDSVNNKDWGIKIAIKDT